MTFGTRISDSLYTADQPSKEQLRELRGQAFRRIIDLRQAAEDHGFDEPSMAATADEADLTLAHVRTLEGWLADPANPKTLIHCGSSNRVGAVLALRAGWLQGASATSALEIGRAGGLEGLEPAVRTLLAREPA